MKEKQFKKLMCLTLLALPLIIAILACGASNGFQNGMMVDPPSPMDGPIAFEAKLMQEHLRGLPRTDTLPDGSPNLVWGSNIYDPQDPVWQPAIKYWVDGQG